MSGLGLSSHGERSRWEEQACGFVRPRKPLARDSSAGRAPKGAQPPVDIAEPRGNPEPGERGSIVRSGSCARQSCSIAEVDKRRAVPSDPGRRVRESYEDLASLRESNLAPRGAKERRKPYLRRQSCRCGGGFPMKNRREHFVDGRHLGPGKPLLLTQGWRNRSWCSGSLRARLDSSQVDVCEAQGSTRALEAGSSKPCQG